MRVILMQAHGLQASRRSAGTFSGCPSIPPAFRQPEKQKPVGMKPNGFLLGDGFQAEIFAKPKTQQEIVNSPSFPRRWESWLNLHNGLFLRNFLNIKQDSRLRGNDDISCVSGCC
ncbi:hypothetical protein [Kingella sp. (in: b-proteobacteria)]|uniref:hypothetical protein n=1 Tax=Kingella sp. (in: b-proteobacteria) TaxID=2020713 RepID=UPI0026DB9800|nr:hypothetical protein [Kingella sp. (in: b-proteobacteria)]MDO4657768.1 hypothetical protein [Kingella sp. (in: b-proteobacteria)]